ncbi:iron-sulfur cluster assembly scaffold protein [Chloroflexota bacterium]
MTTESDQIPEEIMAEIREKYSDTLIDHAMNPRNMGEIPNADGHAAITGPCGDLMEMWVLISNDKILEARFWTSGCATTIAAGSIAAETATGMSIPDALRLSPGQIIKALDGLPEENKDCALMAADTIKGAVKDYLTLKRDPWKKGYRHR